MALIILAFTLAMAALDPMVVKELQDFRAKHEADYRRDYVTLAGQSVYDLSAAAEGKPSHRPHPCRRNGVLQESQINLTSEV